MNIDDILTETFADHEHLTPESSDVLRNIRAELDRRRHHHLTRLAPILAAAVVIAIALTLLITRSATGHSARPALGQLPTPTPKSTSDPEAAATAAARTILRATPLPPGARAVKKEPAVLGQGGQLELSSLQAEASGSWVIPGAVPAAVAFARAHPAPGFTANCTCGGPTIKWIDFQNTDGTRAIIYVLAPYASGVAIKITAIVPWVPTRPSWSYVAATATSVDVTVQRVRNFGSVGGAPTVHRTLTTGATQHLAAVANRLRPQAPSDCRGPAIEIATTDVLVFHEPGRTVTFTMTGSNCPQFSVEVAGHQPTYLEPGALDSTLLRELGLPANYGH